MAQKRGFNFSLARHYDKAIAVVVLVALLISLFVLARSAADSKERKRSYEVGVATMRPRYPVLTPQPVETYEMALRNLYHPEMVRSSTNDVGLFVPQRRVWCVDCLYPIQYSATVCPYCHAKQPADTSVAVDPHTRDSEGKGIPDWWRVKYFNHPFAMADDRSRAEDDADEDGFTNLQEFQAETSPRDSKSHPDQTNLLRFKAVTSRPYPFIFTGASQLPDGSLQLTVNMRAPEAGRMYFAKKGDFVGKTGLIYSNCTSKTERVQDPKIGPHDKRSFEAVFFRPADGKTFQLRDNDAGAAMEQEVVLTLTIGNKTTEHHVAAGGILELDGQKYKVDVNLVDEKAVSIVLENVLTGRKSTVSTGS